MGGFKRKLSRTTSSRRPAKIRKQTTGSTVSTGRKDSLPRKPFTPLKLQSKKKSSSDTDRISSLRRATTLPVEDETLSDFKTVEEPVVTVRKLQSGAYVGLTSAGGSTFKLTSTNTTLIRSESLSKSASSASKAESVSPGRKGSSSKKTPASSPKFKSDSSALKGSFVKTNNAGPSTLNDDGVATGKLAQRQPVGGLVEIAISFDTTDSMSTCLKTVRDQVSELIQWLQAGIPGIRIAVFAHGDYCSEDYVTAWLDFGSTAPELCDFVQNVAKTIGGDSDKCYELMLRQVQEVLSWTPGSQRSLIMIGDANPNPPSNPDNTLNICWEEECKKLNQMAVKIYAIHVGKRPASKKFYQGMAAMTSGRYLSMDELPSIVDIIMAICYREGGTDLLQTYEDEVRARHNGAALHKDLDKVLQDLRGEGSHSSVLKQASKTEKPTKGVTKKTGSKNIPARIAAPVQKRKTVTKNQSTKIALAVTKNKTVARKMPTKVASRVIKSKPKKTASPTQKKKLATKKHFRENVCNSEFLLNSNKIVWSKWNLGLQCSIDCNNKTLWEKRGGKKVGHRRRAIFKKLGEGPAIFEIGVQVIQKGRIYPVFFTIKKELRPRASFETQLLSKPYISQQVEAILTSQAGRIFVRRGLAVSKSNKGKIDDIKITENRLLKHIDYAWCKNRTSKKRRNLKKNGVYISRKVL